MIPSVTDEKRLMLGCLAMDEVKSISAIALVLELELALALVLVVFVNKLGLASALASGSMCFGSDSAVVCMHLFGLLRIETSSSTESALWDASLGVCFSVFLCFIFGKLPMFTAAAL
ncbi:hypothetical protein Tco_0848919 [Tanacetum coccineum]